MSLHSGQNLSANQILSTYLHSRLRYNYSRFGKKRPPYWNISSGFDLDYFAVISVLFCIRMPNFAQIGPPTACSMTSYRFSRWRPSATLYLLWGNGGPPTTCISWSELAWSSKHLCVGLIVLKILRCIDFDVLAWNCLFTPLFEESLGHISPYDVTQKDRPWAMGRNTSFEPFTLRISGTVRPARVTEKKRTV